MSIPAEPDSQSRCDLADKVRKLQGPILVLGGSGFVGASIGRALLAVRNDVYGTTTRKPAWRLDGLADDNVKLVDLLVDSNLDDAPRRGPAPDDLQLRRLRRLLVRDRQRADLPDQLQLHHAPAAPAGSAAIACYVHAGSSSEYGDNAAGPAERDPTAPNSDYAVSKVAAANLIYYYGKSKRLPCANLRLYSVYGPLEDSSRLIPTVIRRGLEGQLPRVRQPGHLARFRLRRRRRARLSSTPP